MKVKFKKGQRVRLVRVPTDNNQLKAGAEGIVLEESPYPCVEWDAPFSSGHNGCFPTRDFSSWSVMQESLEAAKQKLKKDNS